MEGKRVIAPTSLLPVMEMLQQSTPHPRQPLPEPQPPQRPVTANHPSALGLRVVTAPTVVSLGHCSSLWFPLTLPRPLQVGPFLDPL